MRGNRGMNYGCVVRAFCIGGSSVEVMDRWVMGERRKAGMAKPLGENVERRCPCLASVFPDRFK
jgi:hypothetical protein